MDTHRIHVALYRALQPSLGSIALAGLLLTLTRILLLFTVFLRRMPVYLPIALRMYTGPLLFAVGYLEDAAGSLSKYMLICLQRGCPRIMRSRLRLPAARYPQNRASQQALRLKHSATRIR